MSAKPDPGASDWLPEMITSVDAERVVNQPIGPAWPEALAPEAFHGMAGEIVSLLEPHSEADPVGLLTHLRVSFGNIVGRGPHFVVGGTVHHANLYCVNVGATASRKGTAKDDTFFVIRTVDPDWFDSRVQSGLSSGEGFVWAVRDAIEEQQPIKDKGRVIDYQTVITDPGVTDKRLLVVESEFGSTLRVLEREGNTLSAQIRQAWDSGTLRVLTKTKAARATDAHVSILGHVTREELLKYLNETEQANGFANRILWVAVRRSKFLPDGGEIHLVDLSDIQRRLREAAEFARTVGEVRRSEAARDIWHAVYRGLAGDRLGLFGAVTSRAEAQTMRLALVYALLDRSHLVQAEHLSAALAVWSYCEASARLIFGDALGDVAADEVLRSLRAAPGGLTRTELSGRFGRNKSASEINRALRLLTQQGLVRFEKEDARMGRPAEHWFAVGLDTKETNLTKEPIEGDQ
jgi:DNA-binding transcriptional ArsR family regulator